MKIDYAVTEPERAHVLRVGLRRENVLGETHVGATTDVIHEVPVRKANYESLTTAARKLAYVQECEAWHHERDKTVRAKWDADDKAKADAAAAAAKAAEEAKFVVVPQGFVCDDKGNVTGVQVTISHKGLTCSAVIPNDATTAETNARTVWQASKTKADEEKAALAGFALSK